MANYNPYNSNFYLQDLQNMRDRIDRTMQTYQQNQNQYLQHQQPQIQQTFQLSNPNQNISEFDGKFVENYDDVKNTLVLKNSIFLNKNMNKMWFKDVSGKIRTFNIEEEIQIDEKSIEISNLKKELEELKGLLTIQLQSQNEIEEVDTTSKTTKKNK